MKATELLMPSIQPCFTGNVASQEWRDMFLFIVIVDVYIYNINRRLDGWVWME